VADRSVLVPMILSDLERWDERGQIFPNLRSYARTVGRRTTKFGKVTHVKMADF